MNTFFKFKLFFMSKYLAKDNPEGLKIGDKIILIKSSNGIPPSKEGQVFTVRTQPTSSGRSISVLCPAGLNYSMYYTRSGGASDIFRRVNRKEEAKYLRIRIAEMADDIREMEARAFDLEQFDTEEEYVAYKLSKILEAGSDPKAIAKILKTMKESNML
jgi:hypothetical protein